MQKHSRRQFLKLCAALGIAPLAAGSIDGVLAADRPEGKVLIIGAGAAGLVSGYLLDRFGIDFEILEASASYGGRMKHHTGFADFPISLGAEWLHGEQEILSEILANDNVRVTTRTRGYDPNDRLGYFEDGELYTEKIGDTEDRKFVGSSWLRFFEKYILPSVANRIRLNTEVTAIDYRRKKIAVRDRARQSFSADKVIFTAPLQMLKRSRISFTPALPKAKQRAIRKAVVWSGVKVFIKFSKRFYPTFLAFPDSDTRKGQRLYYDAAYAQRSDENILGLFAVGDQARPYLSRKGDKLKRYILDELGEIYGKTPESTYLDHMAQYWDEEPHIHGAYLSDYSDDAIPETLAEPIGDKLYFAGEAYTDEGDWGGVHNAARAAHAAVETLIESV